MSHEPAVSKQPVADDRRKSLPASRPEPHEEKCPPINFVAHLINGFKLEDIFSARHHSEDFIETRAEYIAVRVRFMAFFYAIAVPLWLPFDYLLLRPEHFSAMIIPKLLLPTCLLPLGLLTRRKLTSDQVHIIFTLTMLVAGMLYFASMLILNQGIAEPWLAGYCFMPFMFIAMLGVFPLTLDWGAALIAIIMLIYLALQVALDQLISVQTANMLWALFLLGGISLWVQSSQLLMLLKLYREATRDPLTGVINRRVLMKCLSCEMDHTTSFCILMFDLDRFKRVNDNYGHLIGDKVLKTTAEILQKGLREHDIVARFGGEEFVAVLANCRYDEAIKVAERIRASCYDAQITAPNGDIIKLSTSVGVTEHETGEAIDVTINRADESLYKAKELGRNRVIHSQSDGFCRA
jgi:diguanylate cyclase (GGDEF)-like protein